MTHQTPLAETLAGADAGRQIAQLREVLALVRSVGGGSGVDPGSDAALDEAARVSSAYGDALPIVQRRFDALVGETVVWAAAGVEALSLAGGPSPAAATRLADELEATIGDLGRLLRL
jgi:hypothetical protein